jgi:ribose transport system permease protein
VSVEAERAVLQALESQDPPRGEDRRSIARAHGRREPLTPIAGRYGLPAALVLLVVFFALDPATSETFLSAANLRNVLANQAVVATAALAALVPLACGEFDVSIGAVLGAVSVLVATLTTNSGFPAAWACLAGIAAGAAFGLVSGVLVAYVKAGSFVVTLGMATLIGGLVSLYSNDKTITGPQSLLDLGAGTLLGIPRPALVMLAVALAIGYVLRFTVFGRRLRLIGENARAAQLVGVRVPRHILAAFVLSGALAGVAGVLQLARSGAASPQIGPGFTLTALAATFLGATTIRPGWFNVPGTIVGVFFVAVSVNGLTLAGAADWVDPVFNGAAVVIAVAIATYLTNRKGEQGD